MIKRYSLLIALTLLVLSFFINTDAALADELVAHWKFNESSGLTVSDELGLSNGNLVNLSENAWVRGLDGNALDFGSNNTSGYVTIADNATIHVDSSQSFTYSVLLSSDFFKGGNTIVLSKGVWNDFGMYDIELTGTNVSFGVKGKTKATWYTASFAGKFKPGNWVHLVCIRDRAEDLLKIYFNGELLGSLKDDADGNVDPVGAPLIIGAYESSRHYRGKMDDLRLYNYALSAEEVTALKDSYPTDMTDGQIVAHWKMDSNAGWKIIDELGHSKGLLYNMPGNAWVPGLVGNALDFGPDNSKGFITIEDNDYIRADSSQSFTYSVLLSSDFLKGGNTIVLSKGVWNENGMYDIELTGTNVSFGVKGKTQATWYTASFAGKFKPGNWVHLVCVRDRAADSLRIYFNGESLGAMKDDADGTVDPAGAPLIVGAYESSRHYRGKMDDLRLYNYALSAEEIKTLKDSYPTDMTDGQIVAHWKMDSNAGWKVIDELGHSKGLLLNMPGNAWVPGLVGNALNFGPDNSKGFITIEDNDYIRADSSQSFTYSVLLSSDFFKGGNTIVLSKGVWNDFGMYDIELTGTNVSFGVKGKTKATWYTASFAGKFKPGNWVHLVCIRDRAEDLLKIYFNGELLGSLKDDADGNVDPVGAPLIIGAYESSRHYKGKIDDLRLYNYALSTEEVTALKDSYPTDMTDGQIMAHWKMDSNAGWKVIDELGQSKGLLYNMPGNAWVPGLVGNAIDFTSGNDSSYIGIPDNDFINFDSTQSFTISALVNADPLTNQDEMHILFKGATAVDPARGWEGKWYSLGFKSKEARFAVDDNVVKTQLGAKLDDSYPVNQWVHIVGVRDLAADSLKLYLNGTMIKAVADVTELNIASENLPLIIGNNNVLETHFIGQIDDVLMYNYAMTSEKVKELFDSYGIVTAIDENSANPLPVQYVLKQNYPNPFNPLTKIEFHLPQPGFTTLSIYNPLGQEVARLVNEKLEIGVHSVAFEPTNLPSGVYFYKIKSGEFSQVRKLMFIK